uniref:translationally-controlled tumor protein-like n=1 Tax=Panthera onca TaxID=9690 RepID=UPI002952F7DD|nr:translationally-controlled tumor protein-like [Panthera onca]
MGTRCVYTLGYGKEEVLLSGAHAFVVRTLVGVPVTAKERSFTKEAYEKYIKDNVKSVKGRLEEQRPERVKPSMTGAAGQIEHILAIFKNYQSFIGENMNPGGMAAPLAYCEEGVTPYMIFFKDGLEMEKC